ncbi:DNA-binding transcriptional regulator, XRE-family HTH domain [Anaerosporobacter mobilis DSM 15930]|jgi:transcriptional regulator with XRE-family HTH domain|uniref:DNA-binding transcriptional regulator, XRE-family HTH domain n=1 Tax=Anaerosporobacter mobilis DSM 15930 TaxID=1120996 RepID=A0A1M7I6Q4_9FIRM|nr:helix-turn-helix transcriptional regulator [Anaerosporobacter mobilis]SHM36365.1 DNA-binding transcriptional regulator, XRE-family HTH domain [Anaerosporobacter mobilis DSM 15930]
MGTKEKIKDLRKKRKMTQCTLECRIGIDQGTISALENGKQNISLQQVILYSKFFGVSTDYLLDISETQHSHKVLNRKDILLDKYYDCIVQLDKLSERDKNVIYTMVDLLGKMSSDG